MILTFSIVLGLVAAVAGFLWNDNRNLRNKYDTLAGELENAEFLRDSAIKTSREYADSYQALKDRLEKQLATPVVAMVSQETAELIANIVAGKVAATINPPSRMIQ